MMRASSLFSLDNLTEIRLRDGVDMRPTLIRVLTDLYVQKLRHTPDEDRHYTELALRLLDSVDAATRADVAVRLARHLAPPLRVVQYLLNDLPEIAAPLLAHRALERATQAAATAASAAAAEAAVAEPAAQHEATAAARSESGAIISTRTANELNEQFFAASGEERRFILLGLHLVAPISPGRVMVSRDPNLGKLVEAAALAHKSEELAAQLTQALRVPRPQARRIASDQLGEPITVALKALAIPRDLVYRILMFVNPTVGHSVERVHALALLFDEMTLPAAEGMVAIWQALSGSERAAAKHQPMFWNDERTRARGASFARRQQVTPQINKRRDAS
jgi:uncharacterized protein (DUF2336 family)